MINKIAFPSILHEDAKGYELNLPSLKGKVFEFKPGLNVIVGKNGSGKTALLNVIRKLTFCDGAFSSDFSRGYKDPLAHCKSVYEGGYWQNVKLVADYKQSVFNLRKDEEISEADSAGMPSMAKMKIGGWKLTYGEKTQCAFNHLLDFLTFGYDSTTFMGKLADGATVRDFKKCVLDAIEDERKKSHDSGDGSAKMLDFVSAYYKENAIDDEGCPNTIIMDEPAKGFDVYGVTAMYDFITDYANSKPKSGQVICALNDIGMIRRLDALGTVNFIELDKQYLVDVECFFEKMKYESTEE